MTTTVSNASSSELRVLVASNVVESLVSSARAELARREEVSARMAALLRK